MSKNKNDTTRMLRVIYTDPERLELGKKLAEEHNDLSQINADFDRVKAEFKSKITAHEAQICDLSNKVSSGYRMESVKCRWLMDQPQANSKQLARMDTLEIVETTDMTEHDKQAELELKGVAGEPAPLAGIAGDGTVAVEADKP